MLPDWKHNWAVLCKMAWFVLIPKGGRAWPRPSFFWYDTDLLDFFFFWKVGVIPKDGWARPRALLVLIPKEGGHAWLCTSYFWYDTDLLDFFFLFGKRIYFLKGRCFTKRRIGTATRITRKGPLWPESVSCQKKDWRAWSRVPVLLLAWHRLRP